MSRRRFLELLGGSALASACGAPLATAPKSPGAITPPSHDVRAIAFDLFTVFDPRGVEARVAATLGKDTALARTWTTRLFEYCWVRASAQRYVDFERLVRDSLAYAAKAHGVALTEATAAQLASAFTELDLWPDSVETLRALRQRRIVLAPLANFAPRMIEALLARAGIRDEFDALLSTDLARTYKPDPRAYALAEQRLALPKQQIAFAAFGGWDAAGARWYGYPSFWVNRLGAPADELIAADATGPDLRSLAAWVEGGAS